MDPSGHKRTKQYSKSRTFNYSKYLGLGGLHITIVIKWDVKDKQITFCNSYISQKSAYGVLKIKKSSMQAIVYRNLKQRAYVRHHICLVPFELPTINPNKLSPSLPVETYCHPSAIVYNDGGIDGIKIV